MLCCDGIFKAEIHHHSFSMERFYNPLVLLGVKLKSTNMRQFYNLIHVKLGTKT